MTNSLVLGNTAIASAAVDIGGQPAACGADYCPAGSGGGSFELGAPYLPLALR